MVETAAPNLPQQRSRLQHLAKQVIDYLGASVLLVLTLPLWLVIAVAVRTSSPGPALFRQERLGKNQRPFTMYKFRSMYHHASEEPHRAYITELLNVEAEIEGDAELQEGLFKLADDARVTTVGRFLRRTSLDELPQLLNVLRGEVSLVGPRPVLAYEVALYEPEMFERFAVEPGITGLWQIRGRSSLSYRNMVALDVEYVRRWSLWLDLKILAGTLVAVLWHQDQAR